MELVSKLKYIPYVRYLVSFGTFLIEYLLAWVVDIRHFNEISKKCSL